MKKTLTFLGVESSCDDTAAAVVRIVQPADSYRFDKSKTTTPTNQLADDSGQQPLLEKATILSSIVRGQNDLHAAYGGVVPEIAARAHAERLDICVEDAIRDAGLCFRDLDGIAVTAGPGLIGGILSAVMFTKGLAATTSLPLIGVNHLAGHALTPRLTDNIAYPYLMLLVSGGHCQFLVVESASDFHRLGGTIDDAPGEAFDKIAKLLGLPQPGGPAVEREAQNGDPERFALPRPLLDRPGCDLSFSGLKTAVLRTRDSLIGQHRGLHQQDRRDLCASFQQAVIDTFVEKSRRAIATYLKAAPPSPCFTIAGGVAANKGLCAALENLCAQNGLHFISPPLSLCTDNAAMIAYAGIEIFMLGHHNKSGHHEKADISARSRWPLDHTAPAMLGSGKRGVKA